MATEEDELLEGELYVVKKGQLKKIERESDLPKVALSEAARDALLDLRRRCRRVLGGFRPDPALVASALLEYVCPLHESETVVANYYAKMAEESKAAAQASSLLRATSSDDVAKPLQE